LALQCTGRTLLAQAEPLRRAAETGAEYQVALPEFSPPVTARPRAARPRASQPFEQTTRYFRGRIVDACRELGPGETLGLDDLGRVLRGEYGPEHRPWVAELVDGLRSHGLVAVDESSGEPRVSLP
jgi:A/G-specific adenine glycosylase